MRISGLGKKSRSTIAQMSLKQSAVLKTRLGIEVVVTGEKNSVTTTTAAKVSSSLGVALRKK